MGLGKITIITPPEKVFNLNVNYLIVSPSMNMKQQIHGLLTNCIDNVNMFIFEPDDTDIDWLLSVAQFVDVIIIDVDNCNSLVKNFISCLMMMSKTHYMTTDEVTPYNLISKNRVYNLDWITYSIDDEDFYDDDEPED